MASIASSTVVTLEELASRLGSLSVEARRPDLHWLKRWRARGAVSDHGPMIVAWGYTMGEAVLSLASAIDEAHASGGRPS